MLAEFIEKTLDIIMLWSFEGNYNMVKMRLETEDNVNKSKALTNVFPCMGS